MPFTELVLSAVWTPGSARGLGTAYAKFLPKESLGSSGERRGHGRGWQCSVILSEMGTGPLETEGGEFWTRGMGRGRPQGKCTPGQLRWGFPGEEGRW